MLILNLLAKRPGNNPEVSARIKGWARELLGLDEEVTVTVTQLNCAEEDCPDVETVIGVLEKGNQRKFKVFKPLAEVTREDLAVALLPRPDPAL